MMNKNNLSTIDLKENKKFKDYYYEWWNIDGSFKPLHLFNFIRVDFLKNTVSFDPSHPKPLMNYNILDIGCGGGIFCEPLYKLGANIIGIDTNEKAVKIAKLHAKSNGLNIKYHLTDIENFKSKVKFDIICAMEVFEHINNIEFFVKKTKNLLKEDACFLGSTINKTPLSYVKAIFLAEKIFKLLPKNTHDWNKFVPPNTVKTILASNGFKEIDFQGATYNPILSKWRYVNSLDTNYFFRAKNES